MIGNINSMLGAEADLEFSRREGRHIFFKKFNQNLLKNLIFCLKWCLCGALSSVKFTVF